ncbi:U4/U6.U5 tri-snRNP-associated protein 1-like [Asterias rubens]|uniref:U4/U6.U5 tri-snRNP-associated protein 1-like n=1 Tax=Asterias rubens TaxID=7604 RepID=UPI0014553B1D|nr:U4/U6.U5 tri-snRNP-associated protein 1-like [Asterias rubens]
MGSSKKHKSDKDREERRHKHKRDKREDKEKDRSETKDRSEKEHQERREKKRHKHRHRRSRSRSPGHGDRNDSDKREKKRKHRTRERSSSGSDVGADIIKPTTSVAPTFVDEVFQLVKEEIDQGQERSKVNASADTAGRYAGADPSVKNEQESGAVKSSGGSGYVESLSIDDTNKIRAKLGLPPLSVDGGASNASEGGAAAAKSEDQDVHKPAINLMAKKKADEMKAKLALIKEKRKINQKLKKVKKLANDNDEDMDDVTAWVERSRKAQIEKDMAAKRAKMLEEMDEEFGIGALIEDQFKPVKKEDVYSAKDIRDLKVLHSVGSFREGRNVILTLKDSDVLGEDEDELMNVNIIDDEKAAKNVELRKKKKDYKPYADDTIDEYGIVKATNVLGKYDEEIEGAKVESFRLGGSNAAYEDEEKRLERIRANLQAQAVTLEFKAPTIASEYYTSAEMEAFKKPRKKKRKIKRKFTVDDLTPDDNDAFDDHGSRGRSRHRPSDDSIPDSRESRSIEGQYQESVDMDVDLPDVDGTAIMMGPDENEYDLGPPIEDEAELELQNVLSKARKLKQKKKKSQLKVEEKIAEEVSKIKEEQLELQAAVPEQVQQSLLSMPGPPSSLKGLNITLNSTSEFCRTLGEIPTYGKAGNREDDEEEMVDIDQDVRDAEDMEEDGGQDGWNTVNLEQEDDKLPGDIAGPVLEEEPTVQTGIAGALSLAMKKGYLEQEFIKTAHKSKKGEDLEAKNFTVEDKNYNDIDSKYNKHDRYRGPLAEFKEKETYKPDVKLRYHDDHGREINQKEAFRLLSHRFHGKGSGKMKTDKRAKKLLEEEAMKKMSSTDTPLNTVSMMKLKQKQTQSPFILLSGGSKSLTANTLAK